MNENSFMENNSKENQTPLVVFRLDEQRYALGLSLVEKVVRAVEITPLPGAPGAVLGVIYWEGRVLPVVNLRERFGLSDRKTALTDRFIFIRSSKRWLAFIADFVDGVVIRSAGDVIPPETIVPGIEYVEGVVKLEDGLVFIHDPDTFLSLDEAAALTSALSGSHLEQNHDPCHPG